MKRIYTRGGDKGHTRIFGRIEVEKDDVRIEANGMLDTLNVDIGAVLAIAPDGWEYTPLLRRLQMELMSVMSLTATPSCSRVDNPNRIDGGIVDEIEQTIDDTMSRMGDASHFLLPGGSQLTVALHRARVDARTAERRLVTVNCIDPLDPMILPLINRVSDLFFALARAVAVEEGVEADLRWKPFNYKRSL